MFELNEDQIAIRDMARAFADEVIRPAAEALDRDERFPAEIYDEMAKLGLFGIGVPEGMGGPGFDTLTYAVVMEELSRGYASVADQCGLLELISTLLVRHGTDAQRKLLPEILAMRRKVAYCITEPEAGLQGVNRRHIHYDSAARDAHSQRIRGTMDENA